MQLTTKFSGHFDKYLNERIKAWGSKRRVAAAIHTPESMAWWYFNEFGTAGKRDPDAPGPAGVGGAYPITASKGKMLVFQDSSGEKQFREKVQHPGTKPSRFTTLSKPEYHKAIVEAVTTALRGSRYISPEMVEAPLVHSVQTAKQIIADRIRTTLQQKKWHDPASPYPNQRGKLGGELAADVYERDALVVPLSE